MGKDKLGVWNMGFPNCSVVKNLPAGNTGLIPDPGRSHIPLNNQARVPQLLSLWSRAQSRNSWAHVLQLQKPAHPRAQAPQQEKSPRKSTRRN